MFAEHMPPNTQRAHFEPPRLGDRISGVRATAHRKPGPDHLRAIDQNYQWAWNDPKRHELGGEWFAKHWARPGMDGFDHIVTAGGRVRRMTARERNRPIGRWAAADVRRWRDGPNADSRRPVTYQECAEVAVQVGVRIIAELKANAAAQRIPAEHFVASARAAGHPPWAMALFGSMPFCRQKCAAIIRAGGQFAVIFGRFARVQKPRFRRAVKDWLVHPTRVW